MVDAMRSIDEHFPDEKWPCITICPPLSWQAIQYISLHHQEYISDFINTGEPMDHILRYYKQRQSEFIQFITKTRPLVMDSFPAVMVEMNALECFLTTRAIGDMKILVKDKKDVELFNDLAPRINAGEFGEIKYRVHAIEYSLINKGKFCAWEDRAKFELPVCIRLGKNK